MASARLLKFVEPMKAAVAPAPPHNGQWLYEVKFDGFRVLAIKNGKDVELWSRNQKPLNERFPAVVKAVAKLPIKSCTLDGEVCALDDQGRSSFQLLQNQGETNHPVVYYAFDLLFEETKDLRELPLTARKTRLESVLLKAVDSFLTSSSFTENPKNVLSQMESVGAEGSIAKLINLS